MARAISNDFYQNFRFHVIMDSSSPVGADFAFKGAASAGFQSVTIPSLNMDAVEYREGTQVFTKKFAGIPSYDTLTLMRGVTKTDVDFWLWANKAATGGEYRANLTILHYSREDTEGVEPDALTLNTQSTAKRAYECRECVPTRMKLSADLDATGSDVSIAELELAVERVVLRVNGDEVTGQI